MRRDKERETEDDHPHQHVDEDEHRPSVIGSSRLLLPVFDHFMATVMTKIEKLPIFTAVG